MESLRQPERLLPGEREWAEVMAESSEAVRILTSITCLVYGGNLSANNKAQHVGNTR